MAQVKYQDKQLKVDQFFSQKAAAFQLAPQSKMALHKTEHGFNGMTHFKYQQYHKDLPVFGATYVLHSKDGIVKSSNGYFRPFHSKSLRTDIIIHQILAQLFFSQQLIAVV